MQLISKIAQLDTSRKEQILSCLQIFFGSLFIGLCAQIKIPLFFTPVPLTGQTFAVMLIGALLGRKKGLATVLCYLAEGCLGLPVWAPGSTLGFLRIIGPTGGYLLAYIPQVYLIGLFVEKTKSLKNIFMGIVFASLLQLGIGALWLSYFVGIKNMLFMGAYPFIPGEMIKAGFITYFIRSKVY